MNPALVLCFVGETGTRKKKVSSCCCEFYTPSLSIKWLIHLFTHSVFRRKLDTIFKPEQSGDQWAKVHAVFIFLSAIVSILTSAKNHYSSSPTSTSLIFALPSKMEAEKKTDHYNPGELELNIS